MKICERCQKEHGDNEEHIAGKDGVCASIVTHNDSVVRAAGTSEGAKKGWEKRGGTFGDWFNENKDSDEMHEDFANHVLEMKQMGFKHKKFKDWAKDRHAAVEASEISGPASTEVVHCRASSAAGEKLGASENWVAGNRVEFMFMPAGVHTICAGFRKGSIELTVACDQATVEAVQASLDGWRQERPKQEPFACVEHRETEASLRISASCGFSWRDDGVYLAAEPTTLGAQNVNGKVHRSWSPSFTTDADYSRATDQSGTLVFPEGVRGSRSNPAQITGIDFCCGTITNKPAFREMSPVKSREAVLASGTEETIQATWSDAARVAAAHARELSRLAHEEPIKRSMDGKPKADPDAYGVTKQAHSASGKTKLSETDGRGAGRHMDSHNYAAYMHTEAAKAHKKAGDSFMSELHTKAATAHREATSELWKENNKASDTTSSDTIAAHCKENLLRDVPDATKAEIAAYEKCIEDGGAHSDAVYELRKERKNGFVSTAEKPTLDSIFTKVNASLTTANRLAEENGVAKLTAQDVYERHSVRAGAPVGNKNAGGPHKLTVSRVGVGGHLSILPF